MLKNSTAKQYEAIYFSGPTGRPLNSTDVLEERRHKEAPGEKRFNVCLIFNQPPTAHCIFRAEVKTTITTESRDFGQQEMPSLQQKTINTIQHHTIINYCGNSNNNTRSIKMVIYRAFYAIAPKVNDNDLTKVNDVNKLQHDLCVCRLFLLYRYNYHAHASAPR